MQCFAHSDFTSARTIPELVITASDHRFSAAFRPLRSQVTTHYPMDDSPESLQVIELCRTKRANRFGSDSAVTVHNVRMHLNAAESTELQRRIRVRSESLLSFLHSPALRIIALHGVERQGYDTKYVTENNERFS